MTLLLARARATEPWANGHGRTATVARAEGWRVSVATITEAAPFSPLPGLDRILLAVSEAGVVLSVNGERHALDPLEACAFTGEDAVQASDPGEPVEVLNLMWARTDHDAVLTTLAVDGAARLEAGPDALVAVVTDGAPTLEDGTALGRLDALRLQPGEAAALSGRGLIAVARVSRRG